jgi:hypothetical protein
MFAVVSFRGSWNLWVSVAEKRREETGRERERNVRGTWNDRDQRKGVRPSSTERNDDELSLFK